MSIYEEIASRLRKVSRPDHEGRVSTLCPFHDDRDPSFRLMPSGAGVCFGACDRKWKPHELATAMGIEVPPRQEEGQTFDYRASDGRLLYQVVRRPGKKFIQRKPDPSQRGEWAYNIQGVSRVLYRLPELEASDVESWVFVVEGEKDADRLASLGLVATTNSGGAGKWQDRYAEALWGRKVAVLPDNDAKGREHARRVAATLLTGAALVKIIELPGVPNKGDVSDWLDSGHDVGDLMELVEAGEPIKQEDLNGQAPPVEPAEAELIWSQNSLRPYSTRVLEKGLLGRGWFIRTRAGALYYFDESEKLLMPLDVPEMDDLLLDRFHINRRQDVYKEMINIMATEARQRGKEAEVYNFAYYNSQSNILYLDLGRGRMLKLDGRRVTETDNGSEGVLFLPSPRFEPWTYIPGAAKGLLSQTLIGSLKFDEENSPYTASEQHLLVLTWLLSIAFESIQPTKPIALAKGPAHSGKSALLRRIGMLLYGQDFQMDKLRQDGENDFYVAVTNAPFVALDNVDQPIRWLADALATVATGMQITKRELYKTNASAYFRATAFVAVTARTPRFRRDDVAERLLIFHMDRLDVMEREFVLHQEIISRRDELLSDYANMLNDVVATTDYDNTGKHLRLADFADVASRIGASLHMEEQTEDILAKLRRSQYTFATEEDPLLYLLDEWLRREGPAGISNEGVEISCGDLFKELRELADELKVDWRVKSPNAFGMRLGSMEEALGLEFRIEKRKANKANYYRIYRAEETE